ALANKGLWSNFSAEPAAMSGDFADRGSCEYPILRLIMPGQFEVMIERNFSSAHQLRGYRGKCENLHGHNYKIEIYARGRELDNVGLLVDFVELKAAADEVVTYLDHRNINELDPFVELQPSAENLAKYVLERVASKVGDERVQIY